MDKLLILSLLLFLGAVFPQPIDVQGSTRDEALKNAVSQYLKSVLFEKPEYNALRQEIIGRAIVYIAEANLQRQGNIQVGTVEIKKIAILQDMVLDPAIRNRLRSQPLYFLFKDSLLESLTTFLLNQSFDIPFLSVGQVAQISELLKTQAEREALIDFLQDCGMHSGIFVDSDGKHLKAYTFTGRLFASISLWNPATNTPVQQSLIEQSLLESLVRQSVLQKEEYFLVFESTFDRDARNKILESLKELQITIVNHTDAAKLHLDVLYSEDQASLERSLSKELKWRDCKAKILRASPKYIKFGLTLNWYILLLAVLPIVGLAVAWIKRHGFSSSPSSKSKPDHKIAQNPVDVPQPKVNPAQNLGNVPQPKVNPFPNPGNATQPTVHPFPNPGNATQPKVKPSQNPVDAPQPKVNPSPNPGNATQQKVKPSPNPVDAPQPKVNPSPNPGNAPQQKVKPSPNPGNATQPKVKPSQNPGNATQPKVKPDIWNVHLLDEKVSRNDQEAWRKGQKTVLPPQEPGSRDSLPQFLHTGDIYGYRLVAELPKDLFGRCFIGRKDEHLWIIRVLPESNPNVPASKQPEWENMRRRVEKRGKALQAELQTLKAQVQAPAQFILCEKKERRSLLCVMPYYPGFSLWELLLFFKKLDWKQARPILWQTAVILEQLHSKKIVHRDIKPHHIFCRLDGACMLTGVALAKKWEETDSGEETSAIEFSMDEENQMTLPGKGLGSPAYVAPEQLKNAVSVDGYADIWSYGVSCYHVLTGTPLFFGKQECFQKIPNFDNHNFQKEINQLLRAGVPQNFIEIIRCCLSQTPSDRPSLKEIQNCFIESRKSKIIG